MSHWSMPPRDPRTKFRLRVGAELIALDLGASLIGRDASCRVVLSDTLASRRHARIQCDHDGATIEDLGSRNGTRVNGGLIVGPHALREGDRIVIGSQELAFGVAEPLQSELSDEPTGLISICIDCRSPYSANSVSCPRCGAARRETQPLPLRSDDSGRGRWSLGMLVEMLGKSMLTERPNEAEKLMREVSNIVSEQLREGSAIDADELRAVGEVVAWLAKAQGSDNWLLWLSGVREQLKATRP